MSSSVKVRVREEVVVIDPLTIFQRICISKQSEEDLKGYLQYELAPYPLSLFDDSGMRKTKKSTLYDVLEPSIIDVKLPDFDITVDGGFLLHKVVLSKDLSVSSICLVYVNSLLKNYPSNTCAVIFDVYFSTRSTKEAE